MSRVGANLVLDLGFLCLSAGVSIQSTPPVLLFPSGVLYVHVLSSGRVIDGFSGHPSMILGEGQITDRGPRTYTGSKSFSSCRERSCERSSSSVRIFLATSVHSGSHRSASLGFLLLRASVTTPPPPDSATVPTWPKRRCLPPPRQSALTPLPSSHRRIRVVPSTRSKGAP